MHVPRRNPERTARRRELARREFIERVKRAPMLVQSDWVMEREEPDGELVRVPKVHQRLRLAGAGHGFGLIADLGDSCIVHLRRPLDVSRLRGVRPVKATDLDFDRLIRPYADRTLGHFSYAHTTPYWTYDFNTNYDPLSNDSANWVVGYDFGTVAEDHKTTGGMLVSPDLAYSDDCATHYRAVNAAMSVSDYSVEVNLLEVGRNPANDWWCYAGVLGRYNPPDTDRYNCYVKNTRSATDGYADIRLYAKVGGVGQGLQGSYSIGNYASVSGLLRLEMVGQQVKAYWEEAQVIDVTGTGPTTAYNAGLTIKHPQGDTTPSADSPHMDDYAVYVGGGARPKVSATLADGRARLVR